ncbi:MAG: hypothetical protein ACLGHN_07155 [Bacteriovoracia bacterium]
MKELLPAFVTLLALSTHAFSAEQKLFSMEKNYNSENVMIIHTQTDKDCKFVTSNKNSEKNYVEFYWVMENGKYNKEVHSMIRSEIKDRVKFEGINSRRDSFKVRLNDLSEVRHDLTDPTMEVVSELVNGECTVKSIISLGASAKYKKIDLQKTYCEVTKNFIGVPNGCRYIELEGKDVGSGETVKVRFKQK